MKIAIKGKGELKYVDAENVLVRGKPLSKIFDHVDELTQAYQSLENLLANKTIIKEGDVVLNDEKLVEVKNPQVFENPKKPLHMYHVVDGKLKINKKKVGAL